jgi:hypothetical protein
VLPWRPATGFETLLERAYAAGDVTACLALLRGSEFALPMADDGGPAWATLDADGTTWLLAYTSVEAMRTAAAGRDCRVATLPALAAAWPDPRWGLAVNAGLAVHLELAAGTVARLAVPGLAETLAAEPGTPPPVLQKVLSEREFGELVRGRRRVSGYVHPLVDVAGAATAEELLDALGEPAGPRSAAGSVVVLRWPVVGPALYRSPYGGTDDERAAAVAGWVVEEPPFGGLGLGRNPGRVVREYKVDGVGLPAGAELWEVGADGAERRRAELDAVPDPWWSFRDGADGPVTAEVAEDGVRLVGAGGEPAVGVAFVTTVGEWRGEPVQVQEQRGYELLVEYTGGRAPVGRALGFERVERGVYRGWVPRAGVRDRREHRVPLDLAGR